MSLLLSLQCPPQPLLDISTREAPRVALLCICVYCMGRLERFVYFAHAGELSAGKVLRAVRLCLYVFCCCFTHHAGAFVGKAPASTLRQAGQLLWHRHGSLAAGPVIDYQKQLVSSTYNTAYRASRLQNSWALGHAADEEASASGITEVSVITTATSTVVVAAATAAEAAPPLPATAVKSTAPSFLAAVIKAREDRDDAAQVILYFAFGANMSPSVLTGKRGVTPVASAPAQALAFATEPEQRQQYGGGNIKASPAEDEGRERRICLSFSHRAGIVYVRLD